MKLSIAVPSFNYVKFIEACLKSIQNQNYENFEVLIADGGSTDGSLDIIKRFCAEDNRFRLVSTEDKGQADAIQKAFSLASGVIHGFLNADDTYLCDDAFSSVIKYLTDYRDISIVSFGGNYIDANGKWLKPINYRYHPMDGFHLMKYRTAVLQPATFWRRKVYDSIPWPAQYNFVFDVVFFYRAYQQYSWLELTKPLAGYRLHGDNKSMSVKAERVRELADFEEIKFGHGSFRSRYLKLVARVVAFLGQWGKVGDICNRLIYLTVNCLAFLTVYRLPGI